MKLVKKVDMAGTWMVDYSVGRPLTAVCTLCGQPLWIYPAHMYRKPSHKEVWRDHSTPEERSACDMLFAVVKGAKS